MRTQMLRETRNAKRIAQNLVRGAGRIFDISGCYNTALRIKFTTQDSLDIDRDSLRNDWRIVGNDIRNSMIRYEEKNGEKQ